MSHETRGIGITCCSVVNRTLADVRLLHINGKVGRNGRIDYKTDFSIG